MTFQNCQLIEEISYAFERIHARLDSRCQQLIREVNRHSHHSPRKSQFQDETTLVFSPINQRQLEENINRFGRLIVSTSLSNIDRCDSMLTNSTSTTNTMDSILSSHQRSMRRATLPRAIAEETSFDNGRCRIIGKRGRQKGQFSNPQDVMLLTNPSRTLLVSDSINQNVQLFSCEKGLCTGTFSSNANSKQIPLRRPIGLSKTFVDNATCLVTDYDQHCLSHWMIDENGNGKLLKKFGQKSLLGPKGVCVGKQSGTIAVADNKGNSICFFDSSGLFLHRFGTRGAELHELAGPHYVQFAEEDNDRNLIVTDFYNNCVKIFDIERHGQPITSFGSLGTKEGCFQAPTGLAIDYHRGYIFVSDWGNNRIQIFDRQGTFIRSLELPKSDMLYGPQGLDYDSIHQTLAIANSGKHCALVVQID